MMYRTPVIPMLNVVTAGITAAALAGAYPASVLIGWVAAFVIVTLWRLDLWNRFRKSDPAVDTDVWRHRFAAGAVVTGCLWGLTASVMFTTTDLTHHVFVVFVLGGMTAGAVIGNATYMPAFYGFTLPAILPMAMSLLVYGDAWSVKMALLMLAFSAVLALAGRNMHRWVESTTRLQVEREQLIERLKYATETLEREVATSREREDALQQITTTLEDQGRSVLLLNGMVQRLQEATTEEEITEIVSGYAPQILPGRAGTLFMTNNSQNMLSSIASWGAWKAPRPTLRLTIAGRCGAARCTWSAKTAARSAASMCIRNSAGPMPVSRCSDGAASSDCSISKGTWPVPGRTTDCRLSPAI